MKKPNQSLPKKLVTGPTPGLAAGSDENMLAGAQKQIRNNLPARYQPMWDQLAEMRDTNESIRLHMAQMQMQMQVSYSEYWDRKRQLDDQLLGIISEHGYNSEQYSEKLKAMNAEQIVAEKHMTQIVRVHATLAKEYRQCAMQKRYTVHITLVSQLVMAVHATLHQHIHDQQLLNAISDDLERSMQALFPMDAGSDG